MDALLGPLIEKLTDLLVEEVKSLKGVRAGVKSLKDELEIIQPLLRDAEAKSEIGKTSQAVKAWVNQIRVQADRIEDLVDNYRYNITELQNEKGLTGYVGRVKSLMPRRKIASQIETIKESLHDIKGRGVGYGLRPLDRAGPSLGLGGAERLDPRLESLFLEEKEFIGVETVRDEIIDELVKDPAKFLVISLVGEGGVGKTTLAKNVFDNGAVMGHFEPARAWITVSQPYDSKKILETLAEKLRVGSREVNTVEDLIGCLKSHLRTKRYLIVFDDVWEESFWDEVKLALPRNNDNGSRIVITTRNSLVADRSKNSPRDLVRHIRPWPQAPAFELFCKTAFGTEFQGSCPDELLESSMEIVSKSQGLPLVIAAISGLLATKEKKVSEWEKVLCALNSKIRRSSSELTRVHKILSLSYDDLPHYLRPCFMYMCLFPEDYSIADEQLYRLWIAEGFVKAKENKTSEEVAEEYLAELVERNLMSLDQFEEYVGEGNFYRIHDLMRAVILSRAEDVSFCRIWDPKLLKFTGKGRRLIISGDAKKALENVESTGIRTIFLSHTSDDQLTDAFMSSLFQKFKLLEVLDFESSHMETLPKELGKMLFLKYLSLKKTKVKSLPKSIRKLQKLHSLDVRETLITELPKQINEIKNLQHILAYRYSQFSFTVFDDLTGVRLQEGFGGNLEGLQTLSTVEARPDGAALMRELEKLESLRWLDIMGLTSDLNRSLCSIVGKMKRLERLALISASETELLSLQHVTSPPPSLLELLLIGRLEILPGWVHELQSLRRLTLVSSRLTREAIEALKSLPNLEIFMLREAYEGEELCFEAGGFQRLKKLVLSDLRNLRTMKIERGALVVLQQLEILSCPVLQDVPDLQHLKNLNSALINGYYMI